MRTWKQQSLACSGSCCPGAIVNTSKIRQPSVAPWSKTLMYQVGPVHAFLPHAFPPRPKSTYRSTRDRHLNFSTGSTHQLAELGADASEQGQAVILGQGAQEVLDGLAAGASALLELGDNGRLVAGGQRRGLEDGGQLGVLLD